MRDVRMFLDPSRPQITTPSGVTGFVKREKVRLHSPVVQIHPPLNITDRTRVGHSLAVTRNLQTGEQQESRAAANPKAQKKQQEGRHGMLLNAPPPCYSEHLEH